MEMRAEDIKREVARLKSKFRTSNAEEMCEALGIRVSRKPMGTSSNSCKGFFLVHNRCKTAVVNSDLDEMIQGVILPHELAHGVLHVDRKIRTFHELSYLDEKDLLEREANIFAAEFLVDDTTLFDILDSQMDFFHLASILSVPPELLDFKLRLLKQQGYPVNAPYIAQSDFLKRDIGKPLT
ncbi:MAG: ImmA/IrrE family metallo-endopeptidase [Oscillospiraceae bacterium]